jgi:hypothetical protein
MFTFWTCAMEATDREGRTILASARTYIIMTHIDKAVLFTRAQVEWRAPPYRKTDCG